jgi:hypothetical protein
MGQLKLTFELHNDDDVVAQKYEFCLQRQRGRYYDGGELVESGDFDLEAEETADLFVQMLHAIGGAWSAVRTCFLHELIERIDDGFVWATPGLKEEAQRLWDLESEQSDCEHLVTKAAAGELRHCVPTDEQIAEANKALKPHGLRVSPKIWAKADHED